MSTPVDVISQQRTVLERTEDDRAYWRARWDTWYKENPSPRPLQGKVSMILGLGEVEIVAWRGAKERQEAHGVRVSVTRKVLPLKRWTLGCS